jgi:hypothetical protein
LYNTQRALRNDFQKEKNINDYHFEFDKSYQQELIFFFLEIIS